MILVAEYILTVIQTICFDWDTLEVFEGLDELKVEFATFLHQQDVARNNAVPNNDEVYWEIDDFEDF
jgi:hypothetical protein